MGSGGGVTVMTLPVELPVPPHSSPGITCLPPPLFRQAPVWHPHLPAARRRPHSRHYRSAGVEGAVGPGVVGGWGGGHSAGGGRSSMLDGSEPCSTYPAPCLSPSSLHPLTFSEAPGTEGVWASPGGTAHSTPPTLPPYMLSPVTPITPGTVGGWASPGGTAHSTARASARGHARTSASPSSTQQRHTCSQVSVNED